MRENFVIFFSDRYDRQKNEVKIADFFYQMYGTSILTGLFYTAS